jgi:hypothetical protein
MNKAWYQSKTIWVNLAALLTATGLWAETGFDMTQVVTLMAPAALAVVNVVLRAVTKTGIE